MADRGLHIAIDGRELVGQTTGVGRYLQALIERWARMEGPHRFTVFAPAPPPSTWTHVSPRVSWEVLAAERAGTLWEQTRLPAAVNRAGADVLLSPAYTAPLRVRCPIVLAIHDVSYFTHPEWFSGREGLRRRWLTRRSAARASAIMALSQFGAREIARFLRVPRDRIHVIPLGPPEVPARSVNVAREPLVIFAGSLFTRRRIPETLAGFADMARRVPAARLIFAGDNRTMPHVDPLAISKDLGIADRVTALGYVSDDALAQLYGRARAFVFLSDYEGFGLTPLEAIARGTPPVLLDTDVMREVYGDAATFVTLAPAAIGAALERLLQDDGAHAEAVARGRQRLDEYSWERTAAATLRLLESAVRGR